ncbi:MAG: hypothetical protein EB830_06895 [Nitrosopumilus sp. H13]|nr:MAG: hypothetical protein EB830_06895 [Nitrosopumilus sp. H13]
MIWQASAKTPAARRPGRQLMVKYDMEKDNVILMPDTNVWGDYWVNIEAYRYESKKKKSKKNISNPADIAALVGSAIDKKKIIIPVIIHREIHGVIRHRFANNSSLNLGKNKKKILETAIKKADRMHAEYRPVSVDFTEDSRKRASKVYEDIRNDNTPEMMEKKTKWALKKKGKRWEELGSLKKKMPPDDYESNPEYKDIKILASAVEAAREKRVVLITHDRDFTVFSEEICRKLPVDVADANSLVR